MANPGTLKLFVKRTTKDEKLRVAIAEETREVIDTRAILRDRTKEIALEVEGFAEIGEDDFEAITE